MHHPEAVRNFLATTEAMLHFVLAKKGVATVSTTYWGRKKKMKDVITLCVG